MITCPNMKKKHTCSFFIYELFDVRNKYFHLGKVAYNEKYSIMPVICNEEIVDKIHGYRFLMPSGNMKRLCWDKISISRFICVAKGAIKNEGTQSFLHGRPKNILLWTMQRLGIPK